MADDALDDYDAEDIDIDDAVALVEERASSKGPVAASAEDWISISDSAIVFRDAVVIDGDLEFPPETYRGVTVIFEKGLSVSGVLQDAGGDESVVVVLGDLDAKHLVCTVPWLVTGDVKVEGTAFGFGTGDHQFDFDGEATCDVLVTSGYIAEFSANETVDAEDDPSLMHPECLTEDDEIDVARVVVRLRADQSILAD